MVDANVPDIALEPDKTVKKVNRRQVFKNNSVKRKQHSLRCHQESPVAQRHCLCSQVQDKFRLDLSDEEAVQYINSVIDVSVSATVAAVMERLHGLAQVRLCYVVKIFRCDLDKFCTHFVLPFFLTFSSRTVENKSLSADLTGLVWSFVPCFFSDITAVKTSELSGRVLGRD